MPSVESSFFGVTRAMLRILGRPDDRYVEKGDHSLFISGTADNIYVALTVFPDDPTPRVRVMNLRSLYGVGSGGGKGVGILRRIESASRALGYASIEIDKGNDFWKRLPDYVPTGEYPVTHRKML